MAWSDVMAVPVAIAQGKPIVGLPQTYPQKMGLQTVVFDRSSSFEQSTSKGEQILAKCRNSVASKVGSSALKALWYLEATFSERVVVGEIQPLEKAVSPEVRPGGYTPIGEALSRTVEKLRDFRKVVMEAESVIRQDYFLLFSDLDPSNEHAEVTKRGFDDLEDYVKEFKVNLVVLRPKSGSNEFYTARVSAMGATLKELEDTDPDTLVEFIVDAVTNASRKVY